MYTDNDFRLYHHGILGQKWGIRRYQNSDGSLTPAGKKRYSVESIRNGARKKANSVKNSYNNLSDGQKKALKVGSAALGTALALYGAKRFGDVLSEAKAEAYQQAFERVAQENARVWVEYQAGSHFQGSARDMANQAAARNAEKVLSRYKR